MVASGRMARLAASLVCLLALPPAGVSAQSPEQGDGSSTLSPTPSLTFGPTLTPTLLSTDTTTLSDLISATLLLTSTTGLVGDATASASLAVSTEETRTRTPPEIASKLPPQTPGSDVTATATLQTGPTLLSTSVVPSMMTDPFPSATEAPTSTFEVSPTATLAATPSSTESVEAMSTETTTMTSTRSHTPFPIATESVVPVYPGSALVVYSSAGTGLSCTSTEFTNCKLSSPPIVFSARCSAASTSNCLSFLMELTTEAGSCLSSRYDGVLVIKTCPARTAHTSRGILAKVLGRRQEAAAEVSSEHWSLAPMDPARPWDTSRMLINTGRAATLGTGQGCLLRRNETGEQSVFIGSCVQSASSGLTPGFAIPLNNETAPLPVETGAPATLNLGLIIGASVGGLIVVWLIAAVTFWALARPKKKKQAVELQSVETLASEDPESPTSAATTATSRTAVSPQRSLGVTNKDPDAGDNDSVCSGTCDCCTTDSSGATPRMPEAPPAAYTASMPTTYTVSQASQSIPVAREPTPRRSSPSRVRQSSGIMQNEVIDSYFDPPATQAMGGTYGTGNGSLPSYSIAGSSVPGSVYYR